MTKATEHFKHKVTGQQLTLVQKHNSMYELEDDKGKKVFACPTALEELIMPCHSSEPHI